MFAPAWKTRRAVACGIAGVAIAATCVMAQDVGDDVVVVAKQLAKARAVYSVRGPRLTGCSVQRTSGDDIFDRRICIEAAACVAGGRSDTRAMTQCVNDRLVAWRRIQRAARGGSLPPVEPVVAASDRPDVPTLTPGEWDIRQAGAPARAICLGANGAAATVLHLLYSGGVEPERGPGPCARWAFAQDGERITATRSCFQPDFQLEGKLSGEVRDDAVTLAVQESAGSFAVGMRATRINLTAHRTGDCRK